MGNPSGRPKLTCLFGHDWVYLHHWETCDCNSRCRGTYRVDDDIVCRRCDARIPAPAPLTHDHVWKPWAEIYGYDPDDQGATVGDFKVFSNGRGCAVCHIREPEDDPGKIESELQYKGRWPLPKEPPEAHVMPTGWGHKASRDCWCKPRIEHPTDPVNGGRVWVHQAPA